MSKPRRVKKVDVEVVSTATPEPIVEEPKHTGGPPPLTKPENTLEDALLAIYNNEDSGNVMSVQRLADQTGATPTAIYLSWQKLFEAGKVATPSPDMRKP